MHLSDTLLRIGPPGMSTFVGVGGEGKLGGVVSGCGMPWCVLMGVEMAGEGLARLRGDATDMRACTCGIARDRCGGDSLHVVETGLSCWNRNLTLLIIC